MKDEGRSRKLEEVTGQPGVRQGAEFEQSWSMDQILRGNGRIGGARDAQVGDALVVRETRW